MILFFDTETTGLPDFNLRARDSAQPHIVQLAALLTTDDGKVLESHNVIVKPDGWTIPKEASDVHVPVAGQDCWKVQMAKFARSAQSRV